MTASFHPLSLSGSHRAATVRFTVGSASKPRTSSQGCKTYLHSRFHDLRSVGEQIFSGRRQKRLTWCKRDFSWPDVASFCAPLRRGNETRGQGRKMYRSSKVDFPPPLVDFHPNRRVWLNLNLFSACCLCLSWCLPSLLFRYTDIYVVNSQVHI